jgi:amino acid adenylation domain-containing protein
MDLTSAPANPCLPLNYSVSLPSTMDLFLQCSRQHADRVALKDEFGSWTYRQLSEAVGCFRDRLANAGIASGSIVAIYSQRSAALVVAILGVWASGATILILDASYPERRLITELEQIRTDAIVRLESAGALPKSLCTHGSIIELPSTPPPNGNGESVTNDANVLRSVALAPNDTAYILFTSGTTGTPKAVATPHAALPHFLCWYMRRFHPQPGDRFLMLSGLSHDPLMRDIFVPLTTGAELRIPPAAYFKMPRQLASWIRSEEITFAHMTASFGRLLSTVARIDRNMRWSALRFVFFGGEALYCQDIRNFRVLAPDATVVNCYGATETPQIMAFSTISPDTELEQDGVVPVTETVDDVQLLIINDNGEISPPEENGEICIRTGYLSKGYINSPSETAATFITNPFGNSGEGGSPERIYRTGDLGRFVPGRGVVFAGRRDTQVKIRGFRIELEEVESVLCGFSAISNAAVTFIPDPVNPLLIAVVQALDGFDLEQCRNYLRGLLPEYMVPTRIITIDHFPLTSNGKPDRVALAGFCMGRLAHS